MSLPDFTV